VSSSFFTTFAPQSSHHHFSANAFHAMKWFEWWKLYIIPRGVCVGVWLQCFMEKRCVVWHMVSQKSKGIDKKYKGLIKWMGFRCLGVQGARELAVGCCLGHLASVCVQGGWWGWSGSLPAPPPVFGAGARGLAAALHGEAVDVGGMERTDLLLLRVEPNAHRTQRILNSI